MSGNHLSQPADPSNRPLDENHPPMNPSDPHSLMLDRLRTGDPLAAAELFEQFRARLKQMVRLRLDRRIQGRIDTSDVLQEAFIDVQRKAAEFASKGELSPYLWLRLIVSERLISLHRHHLGAQIRDASQEVSLHRGGLPAATTNSLANLLLGRVSTPSHAAIRAERRIRLQEALNQMDPIDREVLALRHFEELSNSEVACVLDLSKTAASNRYVRALKKLRDMLGEIDAN